MKRPDTKRPARRLFPYRMRLREKYALLLAATTILIVASASAVFLFFSATAAERLRDATTDSMERNLSAQLEDRGRNIVSMLTKALATPLSGNDIGDINNLTSATLGLPGIETVRLYDQQGHTIHDGTSVIEPPGAPLPAAVREVTFENKDWFVNNNGHSIEIAAPVTIGSRVVGVASISLAKISIAGSIATHRDEIEKMVDEIRWNYRKAISIGLPLILLFSLFLGLRVARHYSQPIEQLQNIAQSVSNGSMDVSWPLDRDDELGDLALSLNRMISRLHAKSVSMTYLDDIIGSMFDCLVVSDARGRIEKINEATCRLTGFEAHELLNQPFTKLVVTDQDHGPDAPASAQISVPPDELLDETQDKNNANTGEPEETTIYTRDGIAVPVQMGSAIMRSHVDGRPRRISVFRDISFQKQRESELEAAREEAEIANAAKSRFLANMSHELRTPLNAIIGFSSIMQAGLKGPLGEEYKEYTNDILESAEHLLAIINDLLDISKLEAGKMNLDEDDVDLEELLASCVRIVSHRATDRNITITSSPACNLPLLVADQRMLKQILINLLSNAVKFNSDGGRVDIDCQREADGSLSLSVADTGIGMESDDIPRVLEPFNQVDSRLNRNYEGTGLGLAITKAMIELHGGTIAVESKVNRGTRVILSFPANRVILEPAVEIA